MYSSSKIWKLEPPNPNADTPARRGDSVPRPGIRAGRLRDGRLGRGGASFSDEAQRRALRVAEDEDEDRQRARGRAHSGVRPGRGRH